MKINKVEIVPIRPKEGLIAFASLVIDDELFLTGIGVHSRRDGSGYRLTYPSRKAHENNLYLFHPLTPKLSHAIEAAISAKVAEVLE